MKILWWLPPSETGSTSQRPAELVRLIAYNVASTTLESYALRAAFLLRRATRRLEADRTPKTDERAFLLPSHEPKSTEITLDPFLKSKRTNNGHRTAQRFWPTPMENPDRRPRQMNCC